MNGLRLNKILTHKLLLNPNRVTTFTLSPHTNSNMINTGLDKELNCFVQERDRVQLITPEYITHPDPRSGKIVPVVAVTGKLITVDCDGTHITVEDGLYQLTYSKIVSKIETILNDTLTIDFDGDIEGQNRAAIKILKLLHTFVK